MRNQRDHRNWTKGYQEALNDILDCINEGSEAQALEWIRNNGNEDTRKHLEEVVK